MDREYVQNEISREITVEILKHLFICLELLE